MQCHKTIHKSSLRSVKASIPEVAAAFAALQNIKNSKRTRMHTLIEESTFFTRGGMPPLRACMTTLKLMPAHSGSTTSKPSFLMLSSKSPEEVCASECKSALQRGGAIRTPNNCPKQQWSAANDASPPASFVKTSWPRVSFHQYQMVIVSHVL